MSSDNLLHYAGSPVVLGRRAYRQEPDFKPRGLWVSVGDDWRRWCDGEDFNQDRLSACHRVELSNNANILRIEDAAGVDRFTSKFYRNDTGWRFDGGIDWRMVADQWQGIIIAPYCYERRMEPNTFWYYPWDCASGCIWDLSAIAAVTLLESSAVCA